MRPLPDSSLPSIPWRDTWAGQRRALRHLATPESIISFYCKHTGVPYSWLAGLLDEPTNVVVPYLSAVKTAAYRSINHLGTRARFYVDLATLAGYPDNKHRALVDDPDLWLSTNTPSQFSSGFWKDRFHQTFSASLATPFVPVDFHTFIVSRWMWLTDGATRFSLATLDDELVKTKFGAALSLSDERLLQLVESPTLQEEEIGVFIKPDEPGYKRRLIANLPLGAYITAAYIKYILSCFVGDSPSFMKLSPTPVDGLGVIEALRNGRTAMPLDESSYDYNFTSETWEGFNAFLLATFPGNEGVKLFTSYVGRLMWRAEDRTGVWRAGMPSGLALTSYVNSWVNYIKQCELIDSDYHWAAGDDVLTFSDMRLSDVASEYEKFGAVVNSTKNWTSNVCAEYLKVLYHHRGSTGYPARIYSSLIWSHKSVFTVPQVKLAELAELWKQFYDRCGLPMDLAEVSRDLSRAVSQKLSGFSSAVAAEWLHASRACGGYGRLPWNNATFRWTNVIERKLRYEKVLIRVPEVLRYASDATEFTRTYNRKRGRHFSMGPPLRLPPVTSMATWEARLNGEDNPVKGAFRNMALGTIPLPVVDGVSTRVMSFFASALSLNVLPNLRGDSGKVVSRLDAAAAHLADHVRVWMADRGLTEVS